MTLFVWMIPGLPFGLFHCIFFIWKNDQFKSIIHYNWRIKSALKEFSSIIVLNCSEEVFSRFQILIKMKYSRFYQLKMPFFTPKLCAIPLFIKWFFIKRFIMNTVSSVSVSLVYAWSAARKLYFYDLQKSSEESNVQGVDMVTVRFFPPPFSAGAIYSSTW